jgi:hypothetical protein
MFYESRVTDIYLKLQRMKTEALQAKQWRVMRWCLSVRTIRKTPAEKLSLGDGQKLG